LKYEVPSGLRRGPMNGRACSRGGSLGRYPPGYPPFSNGVVGGREADATSSIFRRELQRCGNCNSWAKEPESSVRWDPPKTGLLFWAFFETVSVFLKSRRFDSSSQSILCASNVLTPAALKRIMRPFYRCTRLLSTAKVIFEAHMELTRRAEQCARRSWSQYATQRMNLLSAFNRRGATDLLL
jgi:hypothetical protein